MTTWNKYLIDLALQWRISFNLDFRKKTQEVNFSRKIKKSHKLTRYTKFFLQSI